MVMDEARGSKINDFDLTFGVRLDQNVLWLQITMDEVELMDKVQSIQDLLRHFLQSWNVEVVLLLNLSVVLGVLIEVVSQKLCNDEKMLFVVEVVNHSEQVFGIKVITVGLDKSQKLDLIYRLIEVIFVVLNDLHTNHLLGMDIVALNGLRERCGTEVFNDLISTTND
jgi:hypothetical protein